MILLVARRIDVEDEHFIPFWHVGALDYFGLEFLLSKLE